MNNLNGHETMFSVLGDVDSSSSWGDLIQSLREPVPPPSVPCSANPIPPYKVSSQALMNPATTGTYISSAAGWFVESPSSDISDNYGTSSKRPRLTEAPFDTDTVIGQDDTSIKSSVTGINILPQSEFIPQSPLHEALMPWRHNINSFPRNSNLAITTGSTNTLLVNPSSDPERREEIVSQSLKSQVLMDYKTNSNNMLQGTGKKVLRNNIYLSPKEQPSLVREAGLENTLDFERMKRKKTSSCKTFQYFDIGEPMFLDESTSLGSYLPSLTNSNMEGQTLILESSPTPGGKEKGVIFIKKR
ncbi:hypothetical protein PCASD_00046 [Puccinia coronata f. sp. avenae]|uniref:Uncharacterized protein n=1 Tax=Puccinia coronata f. sp. avenae TaxID=200324 RepID=A0A2N5VR32_9BASI|nr:hypothetical protein PCASD_00046 [Puccinia coronata f. sp. avenae]